ncbi:S41 family peptidase [Aerolutibacter ruishenii]|uniref:C-terminal processing protease CtpA/Prc n=1 Tax=Aerolutibacter ruishenii TaxID=686800 RepID=A0A562LWJ1_9GAMM|nr:S41 family peptidase [Lysobacter ruishenii]TWI12000.1 C-terminal processing protease CtpA/Prc [Lysobacter ruishenii]
MPLRMHHPLVLALCLCFSSTAVAAEADPEQLVQRATEAYNAKDYGASADAFIAALAVVGENPVLYYNAASASALAGRTEAAFELLPKATAAGYTNIAAIRADPDLVSLRPDPRFETLLAATERAEQQRKRMWNNPVFATPYQPVLDENQRVAGLSRLWSEAKFNFASFDLVPDLDWDALYLATLPDVRAATSTPEYYRVLKRFVAQLRDGHSSIRLPGEVADQLEAQPGVRTALVEGRIFVDALLDPALAATGLERGMEIVAIEGQPVQAWAKTHITPYQPASTPQDLAARTYERALLSGSINRPALVTVRDVAGKQRTLSLPRMTAKAFEEAYWSGPTFQMRMLPGGIAYVRILHFGNSDAADGFRQNFAEIAKARGLIIDVRGNGGGNSDEGYKLLSMLTDRPFRGSRWQTREYVPTYRAWGRPEATYAEAASQMQPDGTLHYDGPVAVLTSARTYSAAEDFVVVFDAMQRGRIVGEATGGSTGQPLQFSLPGGGTARICTKRDSYPDGREFVGVGVQPQVAVAPRIADLRAGRDTVLEAGLAALRK